MFRQISRLFTALIIAAMLCSCAKGNQGNTELSETSTAEIAVASETTAETGTETEQTSLTAPATGEVTADISTGENYFKPPFKFPAAGKVTADISTLKAVYGEKTGSVLECHIIEDIIFENEDDFPDKAHIAIARAHCFADEGETIEDYNTNAAEYDDDYIPVNSAEDLPFTMGASYDFDMDGENESVIFLDCSPAPSWFMGDGAVYYVDGENAALLADGGIHATGEVCALDFGIKRCLRLAVFAGATTMWDTIYYINDGMPESAVSYSGSGLIDHINGVFYFGVKYEFAAYPVVFCTDGVFRQLAVKEITAEDFAAHLENGGEYLDALKETGTEIQRIYTAGYYAYWLEGENYSDYFAVDPESGEAEEFGFPPPSKEVSLTAEKDEYYDIFALDTAFIGYAAEMTCQSGIEHHISDYNSLPQKPQKLNAAELYIDDYVRTSELPEDIEKIAVDHLKSTDSYRKTAEALKKSGGRYILGSTLPFADTDENLEPTVTLGDTLGLDFDGDGKKEYFVVLRYLDLETEFVPYATSCCVFVSSEGKAETVIPKSVGLSAELIRGDGVCHAAFSAGVNNTTRFFSIYSVKNGRPHSELEEWICGGINDEGVLILISQLGNYGGAYDLDSGKYVVFADESLTLAKDESRDDLEKLKEMNDDEAAAAETLSVYADLREEDLSVLSRAVNARSLELFTGEWYTGDGSPAEKGDFDFLKEMPQLEELSVCVSGGVLDMNCIAGCKGLKSLYLSGFERIENFEKISELTELEDLIVMWSGIGSAEGIGKLKNLERLCLYEVWKDCVNGEYTALENVDFICGLEKLNRLELCRIIGVKALPDLSGLSSLRRIEISSCRDMCDFSAVEKLYGLEQFVFYGDEDIYKIAKPHFDLLKEHNPCCSFYFSGT